MLKVDISVDQMKRIMGAVMANADLNTIKDDIASLSEHFFFSLQKAPKNLDELFDMVDKEMEAGSAWGMTNHGQYEFSITKAHIGAAMKDYAIFELKIPYIAGKYPSAIWKMPVNPSILETIYVNLKRINSLKRIAQWDNADDLIKRLAIFIFNQLDIKTVIENNKTDPLLIQRHVDGTNYNIVETVQRCNP
jgi:hypothetical protein